MIQRLQAAQSKHTWRVGFYCFEDAFAAAQNTAARYTLLR
jgi:hypothetical protein